MTEGIKFRIGVGGKTLEQVNLYAVLERICRLNRNKV